MKKTLLTLFFLTTTLGIMAQDLPKIDHRVESRVSASISADFLEKRLEVSFSPEIRFLDPLKYDKTLLKLGVDYDVMGWFKAGVGGRLIFNETKKGTKTQARFDVDISRSFKLDKFRIKSRIRFCNYQEESNNKSEKANTLRYRVVLAYKYAKKALFEPEIGVELYHNTESNLIRSIRYHLGGDFRISKHNYIGIQYKIDVESQTRINTSIFEIGYKFKF